MLLIGKPSISTGHLYHGYVKLPEGTFGMLPFKLLVVLRVSQAEIGEVMVKSTIWLVVWNICLFSTYWECHHPN